jgi:hypothetical protein
VSLLGRPSLELLEQFFSNWLVVGVIGWLFSPGSDRLGLALTGGRPPLTDGFGLALIGRFNSRSNFVARRRVRSLSSANPECWRLFELLTSTDRLQAEAPVCCPTNPSRSQRAQPDFLPIERRCRSLSP